MAYFEQEYRAAQERIAQLEAELAKRCDQLRQWETALSDERAAHARTQAEAAAMRDLLQAARNTINAAMHQSYGEHRREYRLGLLSRIADAIAGDAGRAIAERVPLWRELEHVDPMDRHASDCPCRRCNALRKLATFDEKPKETP